MKVGLGIGLGQRVGQRGSVFWRVLGEEGVGGVRAWGETVVTARLRINRIFDTNCWYSKVFSRWSL